MGRLQNAWRRLPAPRPNPIWVDAALTAGLGAAAVIQFVLEWPDRLERLPFVAGATLPVLLRRRFPLGMIVIQAACLVALRSDPPLGAFVAVDLMTYSIGVYGRWRLASLGLLVAGQIGLLIAIPQSRPPIPDHFQNLILVTGLWLVGNAVRSFRSDLERADRERRLAAQLAASEERASIARELHDVVAHGVSVMVVQAGAARQVMDARPERARDALRTVETTGREALGELRHLLGLLNEGGSEPARTPRPGLRELDGLVRRTTEAGLPVELAVEGEPRRLPAGLDLTAYRIVQEALTNALKYSGMAPTEVRVRYRDDRLELRVADAGGSGAGDRREPGRGLVGMRERARLYGGDLRAGPAEDGGWVVRATLPTGPPPG